VGTKRGRRLLFAALALAPLAGAGCSGCHRPTAPVVDAGPVASDQPDVQTQLVFMEAGDDAPAEAEAGKRSVNPVPPNKLEACCNALRADAKKLGTNSVEGGQLLIAAGQCDQAVKGNAPEFAQLMAMLRSKNVPECRALP
jgi:hypothetical protein